MPQVALTLRYAETFGALDRIISLLRRRGFPITGFSLERTENIGIGRMTVTVSEPSVVEQVERHLRKLTDVLNVRTAEDGSVQREYALLRVACRPSQVHQLLASLGEYHARVVKVTEQHAVLEVSGQSNQLDALIEELSPFRIEEMARTNAISLPSSSEGEAANTN